MIMTKLRRLTLLLLSFAVTNFVAAQGKDTPGSKIDFVLDVKPILESSCVVCHWAEKKKGKLRLDNKADAFAAEGVIVPGKPDDSSLFWTTELPADDDEIMPPQEGPDPYPLTKAEQTVLKDWITQGANWPDGVTLKPGKRLPSKVDFVEHIQPILELNCVKCHWSEKKKGGLRLDSLANIEASDMDNPVITAGDPHDSSIWWTTCLPTDDDLFMPPEGNEPLAAKEVAMIRRWIEDGAAWPEDLTLKPKKPAADLKGIDPVELYNKLGFSAGPVTNLMATFNEPITGTEITFDMMPIPGGMFSMGGSDEVEEHTVIVGPFWMGKTEVTWDEYLLWMLSNEIDIRKHLKLEPTPNDLLADAVTRPTPPYRPDMIFEPGKEGYPAVCMTQLAARMYTMWLSAKTGRFYRLATTAEFEFAARNNAKTQWFFGDDEDKLGDYAWYDDNADYTWHPVGKKKASPWGLHDILGNVWEWTLDDYDLYEIPKTGFLIDPVRLPDEEYNRTVRGGSWNDASDLINATSRMASDSQWKFQDPQFPQSVWHHTEALWTGFRVVSPLNVPPADEITKYWPSVAEIMEIPER